MLNKSLVPKLMKGKLFVVSAPAGAGKTTLVKQLVETFDTVCRVPTLTTRPKRNDEIEGKDYFFVSREVFLERLARGELLEHVELHGNFYGVPLKELQALQNSGKHVVLVIDTQGALSIKDSLHPILIFIKPPSFQDLKKRLVGRGSESIEVIEKRLRLAETELLQEKHYHYSIINDTIEESFFILASIVIAETHKVESYAR